MINPLFLSSTKLTLFESGRKTTGDYKDNSSRVMKEYKECETELSTYPKVIGAPTQMYSSHSLII